MPPSPWGRCSAASSRRGSAGARSSSSTCRSDCCAWSGPSDCASRATPTPAESIGSGKRLLVGGLFLLVLGLLRGNVVGWSTPQIVAELVTAVALLVAFVFVERLRREPMLPLGMFRNPSFTGAQVAAFTMSASFFAIFIYLILYLQEILHLSPIRAGLALMPCTIVVFVVSGISSQLVDRISHRTMISGGLGLAAVGLAAMTIAGSHSSWTALLVGEIVVGVGTGLFNPALSNVALSVVSDRESGLAAGVNDTFRQMGIAVGIAALGAVIPARDALGSGSAAGYVNGLHSALLIATIVAGCRVRGHDGAHRAGVDGQDPSDGRRRHLGHRGA